MAKQKHETEPGRVFRLAAGYSRRDVAGIHFAPGVDVNVTAEQLAAPLESRHGSTVGDFLAGCDYVTAVPE